MLPELPEGDRAKPVPGYGGVLSVVIEQANKALSYQDYAGFVRNIFPETTIRRLETTGGVEALVGQMQRNAALVKSLKSDFMAMTGSDAITDGNVATFKIGSTEREIRFEKSGDSWRLEDRSPGAETQIAELSKNALPDVQLESMSDDSIVLERFGDNWRIAEIGTGPNRSHELPTKTGRKNFDVSDKFD